MKRLIAALSGIVRRFPVLFVIAALLVTAALGAVLPQQQQTQGNEGFAPDAPEWIASVTISERFSTNTETPMQVLITSSSGDVLTAEGLQTYATAFEAVLASEAAPYLSSRADGAIQGYFGPLLQSLQAQQVPVETLDDATVKTQFTQSLEFVPAEVRPFFEQLLSSTDTDLSVPQSSAGLMMIWLNVADLDEAGIQEIQFDLADRLRASSADEISVDPFSFFLLFENQDVFQQEIGRLFGTAFLIILVILGFVYWVHPKGRMTRWHAFRRAAADVLLTLVTIMMSIAWMQGLGVLLGPGYLGWIGAFSEMLQVLPILLIGLGVDYAIHLNSRYKEELGDGIPVFRSTGRATRTVGVALVLATVTTAVGFLTNLINPVPALRDFGILAAIGIGSAFLLMLTFFPSVRQLLDRRAERSERLPTEAFGKQGDRLLPRVMGSASVFAEKLPIPTLIIALALGGLGVFGTTQLSTEFSFTDFIPEGSEVLDTVDALNEEFAGGFGERTQILVQGDVATPQVHNATVAAWTEMADTPNVLNFGGRAAVDFPATVLFQLVTPPEFGGGDLYDEQFSQFAFANGLQQDLTVGADAEVETLYRRAEELAPDLMQSVLATGDDGDYRYVDMVVSTQAGEDGAEQLAADLADDLVSVNALDGISAVATNENIISDVVVTSLSESQLSSLLITLLAAMALLIINFMIESRRPFLGVITIVPVALVVLWTFGMMALTGIPFGPVTATIAALAIGIGVPYTIHITHRYQEDRERFDDPDEAIQSTTRHTGGALAGSAFTTVAGFGILVTSSLVPFQQFGAVTVYAIGFALIAAVLVLPSMLVLWDRWHRRRGEPIVEHRIDLEVLEEA